MIERIARRAGGFAATTALRWIGAVQESAPEVELPLQRKRSRLGKLGAPLSKGALGGTLAKGAFAGAVALISSNKVVRTRVAEGLDKIAESLQAGSSSRSGGSRTSSSTGSNGHGGNGSGGGALSQKTRTELYELAKKMDIPGRSNMTKEELEKALKKS